MQPRFEIGRRNSLPDLSEEPVFGEYDEGNSIGIFAYAKRSAARGGGGGRGVSSKTTKTTTQKELSPSGLRAKKTRMRQAGYDIPLGKSGRRFRDPSQITEKSFKQRAYRASVGRGETQRSRGRPEIDINESHNRTKLIKARHKRAEQRNNTQ